LPLVTLATYLNDVRIQSRWTLWWLTGFGIWTGLALLSAAESGISSRQVSGKPIEWRVVVVDRLADWYSYGVFLPLMVVATHRWPLDRRHVASRLPLHFALVVAIVVARNALRPLVGDFEGSFARSIGSHLVYDTIAVAALDGVLHAIEFYHRYRERETLALQLRASLSDARLYALRAQLNPHFLFNTLNAATALLYRDPQSADRMLTRLADLLRVTLRSDPNHETRLEEEMALLERYLDIMRVRFADRITVECYIDNGVTDALVPSFLLQPIVENAIEHGVSGLQRPGHIRIAARAVADTLELVVHDNGCGIDQTRAGNGVGLSNTRRRIAELYGDRGSLAVSGSVMGGTTVVIRVPLRLEPALV
jgi:two-component system, LytTR family, sensor kinase